MPRNLPLKPDDLPKETESAEQGTVAAAPVDEDFIGMTAPSYGPSARKKVVHVKVMKYRVEAGPEGGKWAVVMNGGKTFLAGGKIIDARQYDIRKLVLQGVKLTELGEE